MHDDELHLSPTAQRLLDALPPDGSLVGNMRLRSDLRLDKSEYDKAKTELHKMQLIVLGSGRGGSLRRAKLVDPSRTDYYKSSAISQLQAANNGGNGGGSQPNRSTRDLELGTDELTIEEDTTDEEAAEFEGPNGRQIFSDKSDPSVSDLYIEHTAKSHLCYSSKKSQRKVYLDRKSTRLNSSHT